MYSVFSELLAKFEVKAPDVAQDASPKDLKTVHSMLLALRRKERGNID